MDSPAGTYVVVLRPNGYDTDARLLRFRARVVPPDRSLRMVDVGVPVDGVLANADFLFPAPETFDAAARAALAGFVAEATTLPIYREAARGRRVRERKGARR